MELDRKYWIGILFLGILLIALLGKGDFVFKVQVGGSEKVNTIESENSIILMNQSDIKFEGSSIHVYSFNYTDQYGTYHCILTHGLGAGGLWCERISNQTTN